jgi:hypothetical protein
VSLLRTGESKQGWLARAALLLVGGLGVVALVIGLRAAWLESSAAAALIVGAVLVLAALILSTEWEELTGRFRDASVTVKRARPPNLISWDEIAVALERAASDEATEGEPTEELEQLRARVRELSAAAAEAAEFDEGELEFLKEERERTRAFEKLRDDYAPNYPSAREHNRPPYPHFSLGRGGPHDTRPRLTITFSWWGDWRILCEAKPPSWSQPVPPLLLDHFMTHGGSPKWITIYPDDFRWVQTLEPGTYVFKWSRVVVASKPGELLEEDEVEITESMLEEIKDPMKTVTLSVRRRYGPSVDTTSLIS